MEKQVKKVEAPTTIKDRVQQLLEKPLYIKSEQFDAKDIIKFALVQSGIKPENFTNNEILYVLNTCKDKGLNPMKGEISFFKSKTGKIQAIPKYTTQLELLHRELAKDPDYITFNVYIVRDKETQEGIATAKADYASGTKGRYSHEISLFSGDGKCSNGMARFMLMKQATLQFIRLYYPHIDLGYDMDELQTYNSGIKENMPKDARIVNVEVKTKSLEDMEKELK